MSFEWNLSLCGELTLVNPNSALLLFSCNDGFAEKKNIGSLPKPQQTKKSRTIFDIKPEKTPPK